MKILMFSWEYPPRVVGGIARVVGELSKKLVKNGHEVTIITYRENESPYFEIEKSGVKVYRVDNYIIKTNNFIDWIMQLNFAFASKACELISSGQTFDIIHAHDWLTVMSAKTIKDAYHIPIVATIHATESGRNAGIHDEVQKYINDCEWLLTYEAQKVIVNSKYMSQEIQRLFSLPYEKISVVHNGIDIEKFDNFTRDYDFRRNYASDNEKIILTIGRLVNEKGIQHLICAMPKILQNYHDVKLVVAGKGPMIQELKKLAYDIGIYDKVYFSGYLKGSDVQKMYKSADIAVFPSTYEPFGIVCLEAMLAGVATVVSDVGGLNEIIEHGVDGLKSYAGNANSIADSVLKILFDEKLKENMILNAKAKAITQYNWDIISKETLNVYNEALEKAKAKVMNSVIKNEDYIISKEEAMKQYQEELSNLNGSNIAKELTNLLNYNEKRNWYAKN